MARRTKSQVMFEINQLRKKLDELHIEFHNAREDGELEEKEEYEEDVEQFRTMEVRKKGYVGKMF